MNISSYSVNNGEKYYIFILLKCLWFFFFPSLPHQSKAIHLFLPWVIRALICFEGLAYYYSLIIIIITNNFPKSTFHFWLTNLVQMCVHTGVLTGCPIFQNQEAFVRSSVGGIQGSNSAGLSLGKASTFTPTPTPVLRFAFLPSPRGGSSSTLAHKCKLTSQTSP